MRKRQGSNPCARTKSKGTTKVVPFVLSSVSRWPAPSFGIGHARRKAGEDPLQVYRPLHRSRAGHHHAESRKSSDPSAICALPRKKWTRRTFTMSIPLSTGKKREPESLILGAAACCCPRRINDLFCTILSDSKRPHLPCCSQASAPLPSRPDLCYNNRQKPCAEEGRYADRYFSGGRRGRHC